MRNKEIVNGTVVKVTEEHIVLLLKNGSFKNVPRQGEIPSLGDNYEYVEKKSLSTSNIMRFASLAALFLLSFIVYSVTTEQPSEPSYIIALDINPSIEVFIDENSNVIDVIGLNEDGNEVLKQVDSNGALSSVLDKLFIELRNHGYINEQKRALITTSIVELDDGKMVHKQEIEKTIIDQINQENADSTINNVDKNTYDKAKSLGLSANQYELYSQLKERGIVKSADEVRNKTIQELNEINQKSIDKSKSNKQIDQSNRSKQEENESTKDEGQGAKNEKNNNASRQTSNQNVDQSNSRTSQQGSNQENQGSNQPNDRSTKQQSNQSEQHKPSQNENSNLDRDTSKDDDKSESVKEDKDVENKPSNEEKSKQPNSTNEDSNSDSTKDETEKEADEQVETEVEEANPEIEERENVEKEEKSSNTSIDQSDTEQQINTKERNDKRTDNEN